MMIVSTAYMRRIALFAKPVRILPVAFIDPNGLLTSTAEVAIESRALDWLASLLGDWRWLSHTYILGS